MSSVIRSKWFRLATVLIIIGAGLGAVVYPPVRETVQTLFAAKAEIAERTSPPKKTVELIEVNKAFGLRVNPEAVGALGITAVEAKRALQPQAMPPQIGTVNYDNDHLFVIRPRFTGEIVEFRKVPDGTGSYASPYRPIRFGDRVKQDDLLAVVWSQQFGAAKAALVDAISALRLSKEALKRYGDLIQKGAGTEAGIKAAERQVELDTNAYNTAERSLRMWKLPAEEIDKIKEEAKALSEHRQLRSSEQEMKWARVEVRAPKFSDDPARELTIVEKNTSLGDIVDPSRDTPLFRLADLSRLQIWVQAPEEYLPVLREQMQRGSLKWHIRFQADPVDTAPLELDIHQISVSLDPNQHTSTLIGYLPNAEGKYLVGQFLTATIYLPPGPDIVEIPTDAVNQVEGQNLVFVEANGAANEFLLRRVPVVKSFQKKAFVRSRLTPEEEALSRADEARGRRPLQPLLPGERVIIGGVVELTAALDEALSTRQSKAE